MAIPSPGPTAPSSTFFPIQPRGFDLKKQKPKQNKTKQGRRPTWSARQASGRKRCPPARARPGQEAPAGPRGPEALPGVPAFAGHCAGRPGKLNIVSDPREGPRRSRGCHLVARAGLLGGMSHGEGLSRWLPRDAVPRGCLRPGRRPGPLVAKSPPDGFPGKLQAARRRRGTGEPAPGRHSPCQPGCRTPPAAAASPRRSPPPPWPGETQYPG